MIPSMTGPSSLEAMPVGLSSPQAASIERFCQALQVVDRGGSAEAPSLAQGLEALSQVRRQVGQPSLGAWSGTVSSMPGGGSLLRLQQGFPGLELAVHLDSLGRPFTGTLAYLTPTDILSPIAFGVVTTPIGVTLRINAAAGEIDVGLGAAPALSEWTSAPTFVSVATGPAFAGVAIGAGVIAAAVGAVAGVVSAAGPHPRPFPPVWGEGSRAVPATVGNQHISKAGPRGTTSEKSVDSPPPTPGGGPGWGPLTARQEVPARQGPSHTVVLAPEEQEPAATIVAQGTMILHPDRAGGSSSRQRTARLVGTSGAALGREWPVGEVLRIGRGKDQELNIDGLEPKASRHHACVSWKGNDLVIQDLGSRNGTSVNGSRITGATVLRDGDVVSIGAMQWRVVGGN